VTGVEPATLCLASTRSSQLSYTRRRATSVTYHRPFGVARPRGVRGHPGRKGPCVIEHEAIGSHRGRDFNRLFADHLVHADMAIEPPDRGGPRAAQLPDQRHCVNSDPGQHDAQGRPTPDEAPGAHVRSHKDFIAKLHRACEFA
jgi:hypothetical protein